MFCRSLGSAVGVAVFGAIANAALHGVSPEESHDTRALVTATHHVFLSVVVVVAAMFVAVAAMPRERAGAQPDDLTPADAQEQAA
jgi:heme/copper-type cytochrome/quinol oxidase subunit 2